ncbi:MAG TPA: exonuclease domain-containing protein [Fibrobacteraceae bacterium]|jgi:DNA polymerase-3 subunit alpha (Gram-positive type)|nr:exonuclease domain-containing protein [Fibrobacteraceae bacterium]
MFFSKFVAFDLETTGLVPQKDEIIEIGAVKFTVKVENGQVMPQKIKEFQTFVKPNMMIPAEATRVNHITDKMVENAPLVADCLRQFTAFCGQDTILVAHNADFDTGFLKVAYEKNPQLLPGNPIIDSLRLSRSILPELKSHKLGEMAMLFKRQQLISMKIDSGDMHRAVYDCEMLMEVFVSLLKRRLKEKDWEMGKMLPILAKFGCIPAFLNKK